MRRNCCRAQRRNQFALVFEAASHQDYGSSSTSTQGLRTFEVRNYEVEECDHHSSGQLTICGRQVALLREREGGLPVARGSQSSRPCSPLSLARHSRERPRPRKNPSVQPSRGRSQTPRTQRARANRQWLRPSLPPEALGHHQRQCTNRRLVVGIGLLQLGNDRSHCLNLSLEDCDTCAQIHFISVPTGSLRTERAVPRHPHQRRHLSCQGRPSRPLARPSGALEKTLDVFTSRVSTEYSVRLGVGIFNSQGAHARGAGKVSVHAIGHGSSYAVERAPFWSEKGATLAGIGEAPTAHATDTLQGCHPSAASLEAGRAVGTAA